MCYAVMENEVAEKLRCNRYAAGREWNSQEEKVSSVSYRVLSVQKTNFNHPDENFEEGLHHHQNSNLDDAG